MLTVSIVLEVLLQVTQAYSVGSGLLFPRTMDCGTPCAMSPQRFDSLVARWSLNRIERSDKVELLT